ncbi:MAG: hypothetical protein J0H88_05535 [Sphingomonadales bacterium]|nr:hypothetical protein [Sphingomonadales bacterium]
MLHLLFDDRPWFRPKKRGYGAGLPIAWQGWALLLAHIALITGIAMLGQGRPVMTTIAVVLAGIAPMPLYRAKTQGGWRWR